MLSKQEQQALEELLPKQSEYDEVLEEYFDKFGHTITTCQINSPEFKQKVAGILRQALKDGKPVTDADIGLNYPEDVDI